MRKLFLVLLVLLPVTNQAQVLPGFRASGLSDEQQMLILDTLNKTRILINAPLQGFEKDKKVLLIFFALPNGNTIEQTFGKKMNEGDDWHYDIQHIGAQTRFLRKTIKDRTIVVAYIEAAQKSWPMWAASDSLSGEKIRGIVTRVSNIFTEWHPEIVLNGHSGGGRFIFNFISSDLSIRENVVRIAFLDSDYGYEDELHGSKITSWLNSGKNKFLCVLAYNDSVVIYNGKPLVSPTGGTWYHSKMLRHLLSESFRLKTKERDSLIRSRTSDRRIEIILRMNSGNKIYHTIQVEKNGFIHSILSGTKLENRKYSYFGERAYSQFISDSVVIPLKALNIPPRDPFSETGSAFMKRIAPLPLNDREEEIYKAISSGNIPDFLRNFKSLSARFYDTAGVYHVVSFDVMTDYLSVGNDSDFCRIPMNPYTAQRIATNFGASMITSKLSDCIYENAEIRLKPFNYVPVGNENELVDKFVLHNDQIEKQLAEAGGSHGRLIAGIKKDVILSRRMADQPGKVVIYGWHKPDSIPIQPVYSGHIWWYVDYSHGIRLINNQVMVDGKPYWFTDILKDPLLYRIFSNETSPMKATIYNRQ